MVFLLGKTMERKIISIDISSLFAFFKKPDNNVGIIFTYNFIHKPALLGIFGSIIGLKGFYQAYEEIVKTQETKRIKLPEYYECLSSLKIGVKPLNSKEGYFHKTIIKYNNSTGHASEEQGGNLIIEQQTVIKPSYRIFVLLELDNENERNLYTNLKNSESVYIPYAGKNDFSLWWKNFAEYDFLPYTPDADFRIDSIFIKKDVNKTIKNSSQKARTNFFDFSQDSNISSFIYFEKLPTGYEKDMPYYCFADFVYTNKTLKKDYQLENLYKLNENKIIQLF